MITVEPFRPIHLPQVTALLNAHLGSLVPGWAVPEAFVANYFQRNPGEYVIDPWVVARTTLCAVERQRVVGVAHLLRYGTGPEVSQAYSNLGEIDWLLFWPNASVAAETLINAAHQQFTTWGSREIWVAGGVPVGPFAGLPDVWTHVADVLANSNFRHGEQTEFIYAGRIDDISMPAAPLPGLTAQRSTGFFGARFTAILDGQKIGHCECISDVTEGGALPTLRGWAELAELEVNEQWRNRGVGTWLVQNALAWLRLGHCNRIVLAVAPDDEVCGAGRFYRRFGWEVLTQVQKDWSYHGSAEF